MSIVRSTFIILNVVLISGLNLFSQDQKTTIRTLLDSSDVYWNTNTDKSLSFANEALRQSINISDSNLIAESYYEVGNAYYMLSKDDISMDYFLKALEISKRIGNLTILTKTQNSIGILYGFQGDTEKGLFYINSACKTLKSINDTVRYAKSLKLLGWLYDRRKEYKIAIKNLIECISITKDSDPMAYNLLGEAYNGINDYTNATLNAQKGLDLFIDKGDINGQGESHNLIGNINFKKENYNKALYHFNQQYKCAQILKATRDMIEAQLHISETYAALHQYNKAYEHHLLYSVLNDSITGHSNIKEVQLKYDKQLDSLMQKNQITLNKETIARKDAENKSQRLILYTFVGGLLILLIFSFLLLRIYLQKKRANIVLSQQKEEITTQRDEIEAQRDTLNVQNNILSEQKKEITDSINYAKRIQQAVLPSIEFTNSIMGENLILFKPKDIVSGDFYFFDKRRNNLLIAVADCTGHGVPGGFMSMLGISYLQEVITKEDILTAGNVLNLLRDYIIHSLQQRGVSGEQKDGMDLVFCALNLDTLELQYAGANNPLYIFHNQTKELSEIAPDKMPVAIHENMKPYTNHKIQLQKGDTIYLMSDGYEDQFGGPKGKKFLSKNIKQLITDNANKSLTEQKRILESTLDNWMNNGGKTYDQTDDITVVGMRI